MPHIPSAEQLARDDVVDHKFNQQACCCRARASIRSSIVRLHLADSVRYADDETILLDLVAPLTRGDVMSVFISYSSKSADTSRSDGDLWAHLAEVGVGRYVEFVPSGGFVDDDRAYLGWRRVDALSACRIVVWHGNSWHRDYCFHEATHRSRAAIVCDGRDTIGNVLVLCGLRGDVNAHAGYRAFGTAGARPPIPVSLDGCSCSEVQTHCEWNNPLELMASGQNAAYGWSPASLRRRSAGIAFPGHTHGHALIGADRYPDKLLMPGVNSFQQFRISIASLMENIWKCSMIVSLFSSSTEGAAKNEFRKLSDILVFDDSTLCRLQDFGASDHVTVVDGVGRDSGEEHLCGAGHQLLSRNSLDQADLTVGAVKVAGKQVLDAGLRRRRHRSTQQHNAVKQFIAQDSEGQRKSSVGNSLRRFFIRPASPSRYSLAGGGIARSAWRKPAESVPVETQKISDTGLEGKVRDFDNGYFSAMSSDVDGGVGADALFGMSGHGDGGGLGEDRIEFEANDGGGTVATDAVDDGADRKIFKFPEPRRENVSGAGVDVDVSSVSDGARCIVSLSGTPESRIIDMDTARREIMEERKQAEKREFEWPGPGWSGRVSMKDFRKNIERLRELHGVASGDGLEPSDPMRSKTKP